MSERGELDALLVYLQETAVVRAPEGQPFVLSSGRQSMYYLDVKRTALTAIGVTLLGPQLYHAIRRLNVPVRLVAGVELGGCPLATAASLYSIRWRPDDDPLNALYVRKAPKDHGTGKLIEGLYSPADTVVLVEDVVTTGGSSLRAVRALQDAGLVVTAVVAVVDREEGGAEKILEHVPFGALFTANEVLGG